MTEKQLTEREIKALQIAAKSKLTRKGNTWFVPSQAGHGELKSLTVCLSHDAPVLIMSFDKLLASMFTRSNM
jgi:hypothetical protein